MSAKSVKRSLRTISAHGKLEAIRRVHDGESKASVARDIGVPESTLRGWCKNESKISYLSRQSSPETDESLEPKDKRPKVEQPFNLSLKAANTYAPSSEALYTPMDYSKNEAEGKTPQNLSIKTETPKSAASNRAELNRLSMELGLNRPETTATTPTSNSLADLAANINLLSQWNNIIMQHQLQKKVLPDTTTKPPLQPPKPPKEQQSMEEYVNNWLKTQETAKPSATPTTSQANGANGTWFWNWYKQAAYTQPPILYQQLTKEPAITTDPENLSVKTKSVLDNLLTTTNNNNNVTYEKEPITYSEALEHGEKFLKWLESYSNPSVTAMQIMQFRSLLNNVKNSVDRKNGDVNKTKVKRK